MNEGRVFDNLTTYPDSYGVRHIQDLVEASVKRFTSSPLEQPPTEIMANIGPPISAKSELQKELESIIRNHPSIIRWERRTGKPILTIRSVYEMFLPTQRSSLEPDFIHAITSHELGMDVIRNLAILQNEPGYLFVETPGVMGMKSAKFGNRRSEIRIGEERGDNVLRSIARHGGDFPFQNFKYEESFIYTESEQRVVDIGLKKRKQGSDQLLGGASPEQTELERSRVLDLIFALADMGIIQLPPKDIPEFALRTKLVSFARYFFGEYLRTPWYRVYCGVNRLIPERLKEVEMD